MRTQLDLDEFIPTMDTPEKVYQLFDSLGYKVLDSRLKTNPSVYNLPVKEAALVEKIFAVSNYDRRFQILLFKLKEENKEAIRTIPEKILREVDFPFIIFTPDFKTYTFTLVEKVREGPGEFKRKLTKLVVDSTQPYHTDKEILTSLTLSTDTKNPVEVYKLFQSAFSVEKVTKKFFTEYREVFERLVKEVTKQNKHLKFTLFSRDGSVENFVKILLGRLMFLYFIQKRGWLNCFDGWGSGDKKFLYNKFQEAKKDKKNYFKDYLEPLFFDTLNNPRRDKPDQATQFGGRIPFLNGGLFEPEYDYTDVRNHILLENSTFDDVFSVFEKYNFTVKEDEPLEKEVAIDPEMLGKVFENLLEENLRKGKGTYYTPREIVHYMCHESLINYLSSEVGIGQEEIRDFLDREQSLEKKETLSPLIKGKAKEIDEKLADIKVLDPACGSGAFLVGMLHEVINARLSLNRELGRSLSEYELKKATIQNNIYGVDIDPGASEIAKLRLWLTLVIDHNLPEIEPLPNLDYKIMVGNSLVELLNPSLLSRSSDQERNKFIDELDKSKIEYATVFDMNSKKKLREKINFLVQTLANYDQKKEKDRIWQQLLGYKRQIRIFEDEPIQPSFGDAEKKLTQKLEKLELLKDISATSHFEWHLNFNEVFEQGGFDIVIANPPYVRIQSIDRDSKKLYTQKFVTAKGKYDLYILFTELAIKLLKRYGYMSYIMPNKFINANYGEKLRAFILTNTTVCAYVDFNDKGVFEAATNYPCVINLKKSEAKENFIKYSKVKRLSDSLITSLNAVGNEVSFVNDDVESHKIKQSSLGYDSWIFADNSISRLINKFKKSGDYNRLYSFSDCIYEGLITGNNKVYLVDNNTISLYGLEKELIKKLPKGKKIQKYYLGWDNYYVIYPYISHNGKTEIVDIKQFPNIARYFEEHKETLMKRDYLIKSGRKWYEIWNPRNINVFATTKIITPNLSSSSRFALDEESKPNNYLCIDHDCYGIILKNKSKENYYLFLALLNSSISEFYIKNISPMFSGGYYKFHTQYLEDIPIPKEFNHAITNEIVALVIKIRVLTNDGYRDNEIKHKKVVDFEKQIDRLVYKLYGLTPEEIEIVEKSL